MSNYLTASAFIPWLYSGGLYVLVTWANGGIDFEDRREVPPSTQDAILRATLNPLIVIGLPAVFVICSVLTLVGLFLYESAIIKAGQDVPNA